jgi:hypothetical protein
MAEMTLPVADKGELLHVLVYTCPWTAALLQCWKQNP